MYDFANLTSVIYDDNNCGIEGFTARSNANGSTKENSMEQLLKINEKKNLDKQHISYRIYPNPAVNEIYISSNKEKETVKIIITDVSGKELMNRNLPIGNYKGGMKLDLVNGIYFVNLINESGDKTVKKLVITK